MCGIDNNSGQGIWPMWVQRSLYYPESIAMVIRPAMDFRAVHY